MSKLSLHLLLNDNDDTAICDRLAQASPRLVKVASPGAGVRHLQVLGRMIPGCLLIGRLIGGEDAVADVAPGSISPAELARRWFDAVSGSLRAAPAVYWEGPYNEWGDWPQLAWYASVEVERQRLLASQGLRACIGNFSAHARLWEPIPASPEEVTAPQEFRLRGGSTPKWRTFQPALDTALALNNVLGLHGYNSPALDSGNIEDWLLNYRPLARAAGRLPRIALTEFGIDRIPGQNEFDGWRTVPGMTPEAYAAQLAWADGELEKDPNVAGACVYLWTLQELPDYVQYNIAKPGRRETLAVIDALLAHIASHPALTPEPLEPRAAGPGPSPTGNGEQNGLDSAGAEGGPPYRAVLTSALNARLGQADTSPFLATLAEGTEVTVLDDTQRRAAIEVTVLKEFLRRK